MTQTISLTIDKALSAKLEELANFHGESVDDTLRLLIRHAHADLQRFIEDEIGSKGEKVPPSEPQPDDDIPL